jgi:hypothetical protein
VRREDRYTEAERLLAGIPMDPMIERVWRLTPLRCHTAKYVRVSRSASRGAQATRRRMRALRIDRTATDGPRSAHAALPPTLVVADVPAGIGSKADLSWRSTR